MSYKSGIKKNVILISTMHNDAAIMNKSGERQIPEIVAFYNSTKGGVDCMDLMAHAMSTKRQTRRWPMVNFFNMLDIASIAAAILFRLKFPDHKLGKPDSRRFFQIDIARTMTYPHMNRRIALQTLPRQLRQTMDQQIGPRHFEGVPDQSRSDSTSNTAVLKKRKRCGKCPAKKDLKTSDLCDKCGIPVCQTHTVKKVSTICTVCNDF